MTAQQGQADSHLVGERVEFPSRSGRILVGDLYRTGTQSGSWLVLCHGMESTRAGVKQTAIAQRFARKGYTVLRFDFSFVGESEGRFEDMTISGEVDDVLGALDFMSEFGPTECTLVGSSFGGLVALLVAARAPHVVSRVVTMAAVAETSIFYDGLSDEDLAAWERDGVRPWGESQMRYGFIEDARSIKASKILATLDAPVLVFHGTADEVVPVGHAQIIADHVTGPVSLEMFEGVGHRFDEPGALDRLLDRLEQWLGEFQRSSRRP